MGDSENTGVHRQRDYPKDIHKVVASSRGYTLIELIMVMVLLTVVSVVAIPKFVGFFDTSSISIEGAAGMVAADIRYTQELAMSAHTSKTIVFNTGDSYYTVDSRNVNLPSKVTISNGATFIFNSLGEPTTGGGSSVEIEAGSSTKTITVESHTGRVSSS